MRTTKIVSIKSPQGGYSTYPKVFNNDAHYSNWYDCICRKGGKVIGTITISTENDES